MWKIPELCGFYPMKRILEDSDPSMNGLVSVAATRTEQVQAKLT